jgi:hypothetical protein
MGNFLYIMIIIAGAYIAYKGMIKKKTTEALNGMLTTLAVLILSLVFFANASGVMRYINDLSSGLSQEVMGVGIDFQNELSSGQVSYPADVSSLVIADKLYNMMVYEPYIMLQYGKTSSDPAMTPERVNKILAHLPGSAARKQAVVEEANGNPAKGIKPNPMVTSEGVFQRLTLILLLFSLYLGAFVFHYCRGDDRLPVYVCASRPVCPVRFPDRASSSVVERGDELV